MVNIYISYSCVRYNVNESYYLIFTQMTGVSPNSLLVTFIGFLLQYSDISGKFPLKLSSATYKIFF